MGDALPLNAIVIATAACPTGYTRVVALDNKYLTSDVTYNAAAGGASAHTHGDLASHTHSISLTTATTTPAGVLRAFSGPAIVFTPLAHAHSVSGTSAGGIVSIPSQTVDPSYATVILCKRTT